jgi:hypothetical protein
MIFYGREKQVASILSINEYSHRKITSVENKKKKIGEGNYGLLMAVRL